MSWKKKYRCEVCGYEADVYEGYGLFKQHISLMFCPECQTLQNIVVGGIIGEVAPSYQSEYGRLCPKCSSVNMRMWDGHTCPQCGNTMSFTGEKEFWT